MTTSTAFQSKKALRAQLETFRREYEKANSRAIVAEGNLGRARVALQTAGFIEKITSNLTCANVYGGHRQEVRRDWAQPINKTPSVGDPYYDRYCNAYREASNATRALRNAEKEHLEALEDARRKTREATTRETLQLVLDALEINGYEGGRDYTSPGGVRASLFWISDGSLENPATPTAAELDAVKNAHLARFESDLRTALEVRAERAARAAAEATEEKVRGLAHGIIDGDATIELSGDAPWHISNIHVTGLRTGPAVNIRKPSGYPDSAFEPPTPKTPKKKAATK